MKRWRLVLLFGIALGWNTAGAYPEFIGYGYRSCLTCHYNATGGGQLNDYGRALFGAEIAARPFWMPNTDDERLGECSHFLGCFSSPYWLKPGIKYRRLLNQTNPGRDGSVVRDYSMQNDFNLATFLTEEESLGLVATFSYVGKPELAAPNRPLGESEMMLREYFVRWRINDVYWLFVGLMDKAFGIKQPDHTAVNRAPIKLGQNDQTHAILLYRHSDNHDLFVQPYFGNAHAEELDRAVGGAVLYEYSWNERLVFGVSAKHESTKRETLTNYALLVRYGKEGGHALLSEFGFKDIEIEGFNRMFGAYNYFEAHYLLTRGLAFQSIVQFDKAEFRDSSPLRTRWGFGFLYFPMQRIELRAQAIQVRADEKDRVSEDQWLAQGQLHLSL